MERVWTDRLDLSELRPKDEVASGYTRFAEGDLLLPKITPTFEAGRASIATDLAGGVGAGTTELHVLRPNRLAHPRWLLHFLNHRTFLRRGHADMYGVAGQKRISEEFVKSYPVDLPSMEDQRRVADYLDLETARIDELIAEQQRQRELIEEHRHAQISVALGARVGGPSSGLDGVLRQLPDGWELIPLRAVAVIQSGLTLGKAYDGKLEERPYLRVANVQSGSLDLAEVSTLEVSAVVASRCGLRDGDVLMTEGGDNDKLGRGTVWRNEIEGCLHQNHIFAVRPRKDRLRPRYLAYLTGSSWGRAYFTATAHQTTNLAATNRTKVGRFPIPLPPPDEQDRILGELLGSEQRLTALDAALEGQILLLQEHRQALITHAVTQGIDGLPGVA
jgi:type I restriction enzyme S subunit